MKIIIIGNLGYIGTSLTPHLRSKFPSSELIGYDIGYFAHCLLQSECSPEVYLNQQIFADVRSLNPEVFKDATHVVYLAALSNDPLGNKYEDLTMSINFQAAISTARMAKESGVQHFVFCSTCSVYGASQEIAHEGSPLTPLTAYAKSKAKAEQGLMQLATSKFYITCLRFATACGASQRPRLDLALNDFVVSAMLNKQIRLLSDGTAWRPFIAVSDMVRAIEWSMIRALNDFEHFRIINIGHEDWNYRIIDLAHLVASSIPGTQVVTSSTSAPDTRSYRVSFDLYRQLAPNHQPTANIAETILTFLRLMQTQVIGDDFRNSSIFIRLKTIESLQKTNFLDRNLRWLTI